MIFRETKLKGAYIIELEKREDKRGFFARAWCEREFAAQGLIIPASQSNLGFSHRKGTLRGLHYQLPPYAETKLVRCIRGAVYDVAIDLRPGSSTYKQWVGVKLTADKHTMMYVPEECAHGYLTLADNSEVLYQVSKCYTPEAERGVRWNDPQFNITLPIEVDTELVSEKDRNFPDYRETDMMPGNTSIQEMK